MKSYKMFLKGIWIILQENKTCFKKKILKGDDLLLLLLLLFTKYELQHGSKSCSIM